jgi:putative peptidoglycan binding protein
MALRLPPLPKLTPRRTAVIAVLVISPFAVAGLAANGAHQSSSAGPGNAAAGGAAPVVRVKVAAAETASQAAAATPQCLYARVVPIGKTGWGIPMPSLWNSPSTTCNLMYGDDPFRTSTHRGDPDTAIRVLQRDLNYCYGYRLTVDGIYGSNTRAVIRAVQKRHKLAVDGVYGPKTRSAMNWRLYATKTNTWSKACSSPL